MMAVTVVSLNGRQVYIISWYILSNPLHVLLFYQLKTSDSTITTTGPSAHITINKQGHRVSDVTIRFLHVVFAA